MTFSFNGIETQNFVHTKLSQNHLAIHLLHPSSLTFYLLTHWLLGFFAKNALFFWTFWHFSAWTCAKLPPIYPKNHLQHNSLFSSMTFYAILTQARAEMKKEEAFQAFGFFWIFFPPFLFSQKKSFSEYRYDVDLHSFAHSFLLSCDSC